VPRTWDKLVTAVTRLPGIGPKMAERLALHILRHPDQTEDLLRAVLDAREKLARCPLCGDYVERVNAAPSVSGDAVESKGDDVPLCHRCLDDRRDAALICVVEEVGDLQALERSRAFRGRYHVLGGVLSALDGVGPDDLRITQLVDRVSREGVREVILATNPTAEGETTASYLADVLKHTGISVTRLAYGLPSGSAIQYADEFTLARALEGRRSLP
jgi:recombination protein RecR